MKDNELPVCRTCIHNDSGASSSKVRCHRYPPTYIPKRDKWEFPLLSNFQTCGEHQFKEQEKEE